MKLINNILILLIVFGTVNAYSQFPNIKIDDIDNPNEPSIVIDPKNPDILVAGSNINNVYISTDGGINWKNNKLKSTYGVWGDPCLVVDTNGYFYYFHLSYPPKPLGNWVDRIVCQRLLSPDSIWSNGTYTGLNGIKVQDKEWACIDRTNNNIYVAWTQFDKYNSSNPLDSTIILFSKSTDHGNTWTAPVRLSRKGGDCLDSDNTAEGAMLCTGINSEIYVTWANSGVIYLDKSIDNGTTWLEDDIEVCRQPGSWDIPIKGIFRANGMPVICSDLSQGPFRGNLYINFSAQLEDYDDTDIYIVKSSDDGATWSEPVRVNDGTAGTQQFLSWMTIDQTTGYIYIVFYDRRNYNDTRTDVYLAYSTDGGETFKNIKISESPFTPDPYVFFGDYTNITAHNGKVVPIWTRMDNSKNSIWCTVINNIATTVNQGIESLKKKVKITEIYPNPSEENIDITLSIRNDGYYSLAIYNELGFENTYIFKNRFFNKGKYKFKINNMPFGVYIINTTGIEISEIQKLIVLR